MPDSVTIVGASLAGTHAAHTLRKEGFDGSITVVGDETDEPYDRPPLSKQVLAGEWDAERIGLPAASEDLDLEWRLGRRATALDVAGRRLTLDGDEELAFDSLVIATGSSPVRIPGIDDLEGVHTLRTLEDCMAIRRGMDSTPRRVVVVGAGFIGAEVAATARESGLDVTMIEALPVPLQRGLGDQLGSVMAEVHRDHGVDVRLGVGVEGFSGGRRVEQVSLSDGSTVEADVVVVGVGVRPNTGWLESSSLEVDDGVVCDATCLAAPGIVAAGDIARWPSTRFGRSLRVEHWENAVQQGEAAGKRLLVSQREAEIYDPIPWFWSDQYDRKIQMAGLSVPRDRVEIVIGSTAERRFVALFGDKGRVVGVLGMNRPRHVMQLRAHAADTTPFDEAVEAARTLA